MTIKKSLLSDQTARCTIDDTTSVCMQVSLCTVYIMWYFPGDLTSSDDLRGIRKPIARFIAYSVLKYTFAYLMGFFVACHKTTVIPFPLMEFL